LETETPYSKGRIFHEAKKAAKHSICLHPLASSHNCSGKIIDAHTIQRSASLASIVDEKKHVKTFYQRDPQVTASDYPLDIGWHAASTFTGFCQKHDDEVFSPLEKKSYSGTLEQDFLLGYRALCHEIHQKEGILQTTSVILDMLTRGVPKTIQRMIRREIAVSSEGTMHGLQSYNRLKKLMDEQVLSKDYEGWSRASISFDGDLCLASTGVITPNRTMSGIELQILHDPNVEIEPLLISLVATDGGGVISMLWRTNHSAPKIFVRSLLSSDTSMLGSYAVQTLFAYIENTFLSSHWWDSLSKKDQEQIRLLALMPNAYYTDFDYYGSVLMPWKNIEVKEPHH
jgi:hypothetical protein